MIGFTVQHLADYRLVSLAAVFLDVTQRSPFGGALRDIQKRLRGRLTTDEQIKIFVTENTESDTFCMEEYSEKYTIVVWNSLLR